MKSDKYSYKYRAAIAFVLALIFACSPVNGQKVYRVAAEINPHYIRANQPFAVILSTGSVPFATSEEKMSGLQPDTADFKLIGKPGSSSNLTIFNGVFSCSNKYAYTLVARRSGDFVIKGVTIAYNDSTLFRYDSIPIHVYDDRISASDSVQKLSEAIHVLDVKLTSNSGNDNSPDAFSMLGGFFPQPELDIRRPDGIHFNYADSVYLVKKGETFSVLYSLSFVNVLGMTESFLATVSVSGFKCPKDMEVRSTYSSTYSSSKLEKNYSEYTKQHVVRLVANKKGSYKILPVVFTFNGKKYVSPAVKVVVSE